MSSILSELRFVRKPFEKTKEVPLSQRVSENIHKLRKFIKSDERITLKKNLEMRISLK